MEVTLNFDEGWIEYLREKFEIEDKQDLIEAIYELSLIHI